MVTWQSEDGLIVVVDGVYFDEDKRFDSDIERLFKSGAWIIIWRKDADDTDPAPRWRITRGGRYPKPSLIILRRLIPDEALRSNWRIFADGAAGCQMEDTEVDAVAFGQALYAAWQEYAAEELPARVAQLKDRQPEIAIDEPPPALLPKWLRPGLRRYAARRRELRELMEEIAQ